MELSKHLDGHLYDSILLKQYNEKYLELEKIYSKLIEDRKNSKMVYNEIVKIDEQFFDLYLYGNIIIKHNVRRWNKQKLIRRLGLKNFGIG